MNLKKAIQRDRERERRQHGHQEDGRSVFDIRRSQRNRAQQIKEERATKEELLEEALVKDDDS